jgi:hypothetical protein
MYQLVSAIGKRRVLGGRWVSIDIGSVSMAALYEAYEKIYAVLSNPFYSGNRALDLDAIRSQYSGTLITFNDMLAAQSGNSLPTTNQIPSFVTKYAIYSDAFQARYKVQPVAPGQHPDNNTPLGDRTWLSLTKAGVDYELFYKSCLVSINGFIHLTDQDSNRVYVVDGQKTALRSGKATCGIVSMREIGELEFVPITEAMIHRRYADTPLGNHMYIDTGLQRPNKMAMLVLGGYLHALDPDTFYRVNDTTFAINFENLPLLDRYFDSVNVIDLSSLNLQHAPLNDVEIDRNELYSDAVLKKYATLSQSFIVFVDNENVFVETQSLRPSTHPQMVVAFTPPRHPVLTETGKLVNFWRVKEHGQWAVSFEDGLRQNYNFNWARRQDLQGVDDHRIPGEQVIMPRLRTLRIGTDIEQFTEV